TEGSNLSDEIKKNAKLQNHFNLTLVAVGKKDLSTAKSEAEEFKKGAEASGNSAQVKQVHELAGVISLAEKNYDSSIAELEQANQQNPQNLFRLYEAYQAKGDSAKAREYLTKVVTLNPLPQLPYAFIRAKVQRAAGNKKG